MLGLKQAGASGARMLKKSAWSRCFTTFNTFYPAMKYYEQPDRMVNAIVHWHVLNFKWFDRRFSDKRNYSRTARNWAWADDGYSS
jgi:hypothetical protein